MTQLQCKYHVQALTCQIKQQTFGNTRVSKADMSQSVREKCLLFKSAALLHQCVIYLPYCSSCSQQAAHMPTGITNCSFKPLLDV